MESSNIDDYMLDIIIKRLEEDQRIGLKYRRIIKKKRDIDEDTDNCLKHSLKDVKESPKKTK